jgi:hypothetical protein
LPLSTFWIRIISVFVNKDSWEEALVLKEQVVVMAVVTVLLIAVVAAIVGWVVYENIIEE